MFLYLWRFPCLFLLKFRISDQLCSPTLRDGPFPAETHFLLRQRCQQPLGQPVVSWIVCLTCPRGQWGLGGVGLGGWRVKCSSGLAASPVESLCTPFPLSSASAALALKLIWVLPFRTVTKAPRGLGSRRWGSHLGWEEGAGQQEFYQRVRGPDNVRTEPFLLLWQRAAESGMSLDKFLLN